MLHIDRRDKADTVGTVLLFFVMRQTEGKKTQSLTLRLLMSYIYMEHLFLMFLDHTQRRTTVGRTPLDE